MGLLSCILKMPDTIFKTVSCTTLFFSYVSLHNMVLLMTVYIRQALQIRMHLLWSSDEHLSDTTITKTDWEPDVTWTHRMTFTLSQQFYDIVLLRTCSGSLHFTGKRCTRQQDAGCATNISHIFRTLITKCCLFICKPHECMPCTNCFMPFVWSCTITACRKLCSFVAEILQIAVKAA